MIKNVQNRLKTSDSAQKNVQIDLAKFQTRKKARANCTHSKPREPRKENQERIDELLLDVALERVPEFSDRPKEKRRVDRSQLEALQAVPEITPQETAEKRKKCSTKSTPTRKRKRKESEKSREKWVVSVPADKANVPADKATARTDKAIAPDGKANVTIALQEKRINRETDKLLSDFKRRKRENYVSMNVNVSLDKRYQKKDGTYTLAFYIYYRSRQVRIPVGFSLLEEQWDSRANKVINHPNKDAYNRLILTRTTILTNGLIELQTSGHITRNTQPKVAKQYLLAYLNGEDIHLAFTDKERRRFHHIFLEFIELKDRPRTIESYRHTLSRIELADKHIKEKDISEINIAWLKSFEDYLKSQGNSTNTIAIHLRNIRSVFNYARDEQLTTNYPFRKFRIKQERTRKRSLTVEQLREIIALDCPPDHDVYRDVFVLMFYLIGINMTDLFQLTEVDKDGRIYYRRSKTSKLYSIKVEPEAMEIIERHKGSTKLLAPFDTYKNHLHYLSRLNKVLKLLGHTVIGKRGKRSHNPIEPELSSYWARHTWATIAARIDIPKETIAKALGHGTETVTDVYIDFDERKIDEANRRVIDFVLYGRE